MCIMTHTHAFVFSIHTFHTILLVVLVLTCSAVSPSSQRPEIPAYAAVVVFDSKSSTQVSLLKATVLAFRNTLADDPRERQPLLNLDMSSAPSFRHTAAWLLGNHTQRIVSLLDPPQLINFLLAYSQLLTSTLSPPLSASVQQPLVVFLPRECVRVPEAHSHLFTIKCLQPDEETIAVALMHRAMFIGVTFLIPVSLHPADNVKDARDVFHYFEVEAKNLKLALAPLSFGLDGLLEETKVWNQHNKAGRNESRSRSVADVIGLLILDKEPDELAVANDVFEAIAKDLDLGRSELIHVFTPWGVDAMRRLEQALKNQPFINRLYTVVGAGTSQGGVRDPNRVAVLRELSGFVGRGPSILTALSVYDATVSLMTLQSESQEPRPGNEVLYGISPKPEQAILASVGASLLQKSDFILEDVIEMKNNRLRSFRHATSSFLSRQHLIALVYSATDSDIHLCSSSSSRPRVRITTYDPFSQQLTRYTYATIDTLPQFIIIPNMYGYGLEIDCDHNRDPQMVTSLRIACTPSKNNESVFCHRSNWIRRKKSAVAGHRFRSTRDATAMEAGTGTGIYQTFPATTATDMTIMKIQQPSLFSTQTAQPQGSSLPELRQILKAAKPFVGGCLGSTMGCVMCVLVLGRLPLGPSPALCTGSCAVGVTGPCVALLGRVGAETTVICTELFRQGHIDVETFLADAEFGAHIRETAPLTLHGYQVLASPIVAAMRVSPTFTEFVAVVAGSWAEHMKTLVGREGEESSSMSLFGWTLGSSLHAVGVPLCTITGYLVSLFDTWGQWAIALTSGLTILLGFFITRRTRQKHLFPNIRNLIINK